MGTTQGNAGAAARLGTPEVGAHLNFPMVPGLHHLPPAERRFRTGPLRLLWNKL